MDKRDLSTFQEILVNYFEEEVLERLDLMGVAIVSEDGVMDVVRQVYGEMLEVTILILSDCLI